MAEKTIHLDFEGYWREGTIGTMPTRSGVYCVYECGSTDEQDREVKQLLYIGEAPDVQGDIAKHEDWDRWNEAIAEDSHLCFTFAEVDSLDRERAHAALLFEFSPLLNRPYVNIYGIGRPTSDEVNFFPFDDTALELSGTIDLLKEHIVVHRND